MGFKEGIPNCIPNIINSFYSLEEAEEYLVKAIQDSDAEESWGITPSNYIIDNIMSFKDNKTGMMICEYKVDESMSYFIHESNIN